MTKAINTKADLAKIAGNELAASKAKTTKKTERKVTTEATSHPQVTTEIHHQTDVEKKVDLVIAAIGKHDIFAEKQEKLTWKSLYSLLQSAYEATEMFALEENIDEVDELMEARRGCGRWCRAVAPRR